MQQIRYREETEGNRYNGILTLAEKLKKENQKDRWVVKPEALALYGISAAENQELIAEKEVEYQKMRQMKIEKKKSESEKKKGTAESE